MTTKFFEFCIFIFIKDVDCRRYICAILRLILQDVSLIYGRQCVLKVIMIVESVYMFDKYNYLKLKQYCYAPELYSMISA